MRQKAICIILLLMTAGATAAQETTKLTAADGSCEVSFPSEFIHHEQTSSDSGRVHVETNTYYAETSESKFVLIYIDLSQPTGTRVDIRADDAIDSVIGGTLKKVKGKLLDERPVTMNGNPARATEISAAENIIIDGRYVYVKPRVYELSVYHKMEVTPPFERQFFDSFSLKATAAPINADRQSTPDQSTNTKASAYIAIAMLTPNEGVDFTAFVKRLMESLKRTWDAKMPEAAKAGTKGKVVLRFRIQKKGTLDGTPNIETSSGNKTLDDAAVAAIVASAPFEQFSANFKGPDVEFRATFLYNVLLPKR